MNNIYQFKVKDIEGNETPMENFKGKVLLVVNTASKCGFTPQYKGLEELHKKHSDKGFMVLGFPCNQFGKQEPGNEEEIQSFCDLNYSITFPMFSKVDVNGSNASPFYEFMKAQAPGLLGSKAVKWNFTKFLIDRNGEVVKRFAPKDSPEEIENEIEQLL